MAKFCTKCGTSTEGIDAQFCQSCGAPLPGDLAPPKVSQPVATSQPVPSLPVARIAKIAAIGVASLAVLGGGVWFLTKAPAKPDPTALTAMLNADGKALEKRVCIGNFPYDRDPVFVNQYDTASKNWLAVLVRGGIYNQPESIVSGGWVTQVQFKFTHTPAGLKAIRNGKLCFADGIAIEKVEYSEPQKINDKTYLQAKYTYHYANPAAWIDQPEAKVVDAQHFGQSSFDDTASLGLEDGKWKLASGQAGSNLGDGSFGRPKPFLGSSQASTKAQSSSPSGGFLGWIKNLFSGMGSNPLIGKWEIDSEIMRMTGFAQQFEFGADEMRVAGVIQKVKYEVRGNEVLVTGADGNSASAFTIIDHDHIAMNTGMGKINLRRMN